MSTIDYIRMGLEASKQVTFGLLDDMKEVPLTQPTPKGGNHPLWILGHLAYAESNIVHHVIQGNENPLIGWKQVFGGSVEPVPDATQYPSWDEVRAKFDQVRAQTLTMLAGLTDEDLARPSRNCPPDREQFFGTIGQCLLILTLHPAMHRGQVADARRVLERKPLIS